MYDIHRFAKPEHRQLSADIYAWADQIPGLSYFYDSGDIFACLMSYGFTLCDYATDTGVPVPATLGFRRGLGGSDTDSPEYQTIRDANPAPETVAAMLDAFHALIERTDSAGLSY